MSATNIILRKISEKDLEAILLDMDLDDGGVQRYMYDEFFNALSNDIPEYALGYTGTHPSVAEIREGMKAIFKAQKKGEDQTALLNRLYRKGFFGEIMMHYLLKNLFGTIPLISKVHFKDSRNHEAYGFDAVHVDNDSMYLGEVKFYGLDKDNKTREKKAVEDLIDDIKKHFTKDYLDDQFTIINKNLTGTAHPEREKWLAEISKLSKLSEKFKKIRVPLLCAYEGDFVSESQRIEDEFETTFESKMRELKKHYDDKNTYPNKDRLEVVLILFPMESKQKVVEGIFQKLVAYQTL